MNKKTKELNRKNNELDKKISADNNPIMTNMVCYIRGAAISEWNQEVVRQDLLSMFLDAQNRGDTIENVIGQDYKEFCDEVIRSLPPQSKLEKVLELVDIITFGIAILGLINLVISSETIRLVKNLITGKTPNFMISITWGNVFSFVVIILASILIVQWIVKNSFTVGQKQESKLRRFLFGGTIGGGIMVFILLVAFLGKGIMFSVNIFVMLAIVAAFYLLHVLIQRVSL